MSQRVEGTKAGASFVDTEFVRCAGGNVKQADGHESGVFGRDQ